MTFNEENTGYEKTILSDLQGAWGCLRESVVKAFGFEGSDRAIFHIDEAMSWEVVRDLRQMTPLLLIIRNICSQGGAPQEVIEEINDVDEILKQVNIITNTVHLDFWRYRPRLQKTIFLLKSMIRRNGSNCLHY